jgi:hypothetical protein
MIESVKKRGHLHVNLHRLRTKRKSAFKARKQAGGSLTSLGIESSVYSINISTINPANDCAGAGVLNAAAIARKNAFIARDMVNRNR